MHRVSRHPQASLRHPIVSTALYLTGGLGGPTLVTNQLTGSSKLATAGWMALPERNRLLMFDGGLLHGVVPGNGVAPYDEAGGAARRVTLMIAFWGDIRARPSPAPAAARPFPHDAVRGGGDGGASVATVKGGVATWPRLFDWRVGDSKATGGKKGGKQASKAVEAPLMGPVAVWQPARPGDQLGEAHHMPAYDECWQCLC